MKSMVTAVAMAVMVITLGAAMTGCSNMHNAKCVMSDAQGSVVVQLEQRRLRTPDCATTRADYSELSMVVWSDGHILDNRLIARRNSSEYATLTFPMEEYQVRTSSDESKVWVVDTEENKVIATFDLTTKVGTDMYDEHPSWAKVDGGKPVITACPIRK